MKTPEVITPETGIHPPVYEFGDFRVDASKRLLRRRDGSALPLTPKVFDTLLYLVKHSGSVLHKEQLLDAVWPDSIVEENNLSQNISTLRRVFGEKPGSHRYIVTVPGLGYRFVADVKTLDRDGGEATAEGVDHGAAAESYAHSRADPAPAECADASPAPSPPRPRNGVSPSATAAPFRWPLIATVSALALCLIAALIWRSRSDGAPPATVPAKSVAVLPFENLSTDQDDAFFAEGIQDDILTSIGKIKNLKVIARASVADYRGGTAAGMLREIGSALGVSHVLQGTVRRAANRVVINVALINTGNAQQVWSERYERTLTDSLSLQGELAIEIARALDATFTPAEKQVAATKPTENPEAYLLYLRGREIETRFRSSFEDLQAAIKFYEQARDLDPAFALARARLSILVSSIYQTEEPVRTAQAHREAHEALRLRPDLGEARLAVASSYFWGARDTDRALIELIRAAEMLPNSAEVPLTAAYIYKLQNKFRERIAALQRAESLDPRDPKVLRLLARTLRWVRDWPEALRTHDRIRVLEPSDEALKLESWRAQDEFRRTGEIEVLKKAHAIDAASSVDPELLNASRFETAVMERDYPAAERFLAQVPAKRYTGWWSTHPKIVHEVLLMVAQGIDPPAAQRALESARHAIETELTPKAGVMGAETFDLRANLALLHAFLGHKEDAIREVQRAADGQPGLLEKNDAAAVLALIYARIGDAEKAIDLIEHLLTVPVMLQRGAVYNMTLTDLKWRWVWDPLRGHPRFEKLIAGPEPKTVY